MDRQHLTEASEEFLRRLVRENFPDGTPVYLFGSRARGDARWNSDFDLWIDAQDVPPSTLSHLQEALEESFVPFRVDIVTTAQLAGRFGRVVREEARRWM